MYAWEVDLGGDGEAVVRVDALGWEKPGRVSLQGGADALAELAAWAGNGAVGVYGHPVDVVDGETELPADMHAALLKSPYPSRLVEGREEPLKPIPDGRVS